jgi:hypothetical protein
MNNHITMKVAPQAFPDSVLRDHFRDEVHPVNSALITGYYVLLPVCPKLEDRLEDVVPGIWVRIKGLDAYELVKGGWYIEYLDDLTHNPEVKKYFANISPTDIVL